MTTISEIHDWILEEVFPLNSGTKKLCVSLEFDDEGNEYLAVYEFEEGPPPVSIQLRVNNLEEAQALQEKVIEILERVTQLPVVKSWNENISVDASNLPKYKLVKFVDPFSKGDPNYGVYPFKDGERLLLFGEIDQMPGHCVVANVGKTADEGAKLFWGYHTDNFVELTEKEV